MVSPVLYSPGNGRRYSRPFPPAYLGYAERHAHSSSSSSSHDSRVIGTMADHQQLEADPAPQRKRIAVACGRCRKRKIRCSGDPGTGQPCTNCKNAGVGECLFLRVQSREAPMRVEPSDFYNIAEARIYAPRAPAPSSLPYTSQELPPTLGSSDVVTSYRGAATYPSYAPSKPYYPAYGGTYADEFDYGLGVPSQSAVIGQDGMIHHPLVPTSSHWGSTPNGSHHPRIKAPSPAQPDGGYGNMMLATDSSPYGHPYAPPPPPAPAGPSSQHGLVHRGHTVSSEPANNFSFTGVAASLPSTSSTVTERLLPSPIQLGRSPTLPYPGAHGGGLKTPASVSTTPTPAAALSEAAVVAASYASSSSFDATPPGLPYASSASSHHHHPHHHHSSSSSSNPSTVAVSVSRSLSSDNYSTATTSNSSGGGEGHGRGGGATGGGGAHAGGESIFGEQERSLQSQGPGFDMTTYTTTAEPRRDSSSLVTGGGHNMRPILSNNNNTATAGQPSYVPSDSGTHETHHPILPGIVNNNAPTAAPGSTSTSQQQQQQHQTVAGYTVLDSPTAAHAVASSGPDYHHHHNHHHGHTTGSSGGHHHHHLPSLSQGHQSHHHHHHHHLLLHHPVHHPHAHAAIPAGSSGHTGHADTRTAAAGSRR